MHHDLRQSFPEPSLGRGHSHTAALPPKLRRLPLPRAAMAKMSFPEARAERGETRAPLVSPGPPEGHREEEAGGAWPGARPPATTPLGRWGVRDSFSGSHLAHPSRPEHVLQAPRGAADLGSDGRTVSACVLVQPLGVLRVHRA